MSVPSHRSTPAGSERRPHQVRGKSPPVSPDDEGSALPELDRRSPLGIVSNLFRNDNVVERGREGPSPSASPTPPDRLLAFPGIRRVTALRLRGSTDCFDQGR